MFSAAVALMLQIKAYEQQIRNFKENTNKPGKVRDNYAPLQGKCVSSGKVLTYEYLSILLYAFIIIALPNYVVKKFIFILTFVGVC